MKRKFKGFNITRYSPSKQIFFIISIMFFLFSFFLFTLAPSSLIDEYSEYVTLMFIISALVFITLMLFLVALFAKPLKIISLYIDDAKNFKNKTLKPPKVYNKEYERLIAKFHTLTLSLTNTIQNLDTKNKSIAKYTNELNTEYQLKKDLVASISHEIKTPLTSVALVINSIIDGIYTGPAAIDELKGILNEIDDMNDMLQQTVSLYQIEGANFQLRLEQNYISTLLNHAFTACQQIAINYRQTITFNNNDFIVHADTTLLVRALKNVLFNAIIYSPVGSKIEINTNTINNFNTIEIINYGVTINKNEIGRLFEPFYRLDKSRTRSNDNGNGLGLYIVAQTLRKHKLQFDIINVDNGVKFYIKFPIVTK